MATGKGTEVLVKLGDGASPEVFTTLGGDQNAEIRFSDEMGDFTNKLSSGLWRELLDGGTTRAVQISCELVEVDNAQMQTIVDAIFGSSTRHQSIQAVLVNTGTVTGTFQVTEWRMGGRLNEAAAISLTLESAGAITYAAT